MSAFSNPVKSMSKPRHAFGCIARDRSARNERKVKKNVCIGHHKLRNEVRPTMNTYCAKDKHVARSQHNQTGVISAPIIGYPLHSQIITGYARLMQYITNRMEFTKGQRQVSPASLARDDKASIPTSQPSNSVMASVR